MPQQSRSQVQVRPVSILAEILAFLRGCLAQDQLAAFIAVRFGLEVDHLVGRVVGHHLGRVNQAVEPAGRVETVGEPLRRRTGSPVDVGPGVLDGGTTVVVEDE